MRKIAFAIGILFLCMPVFAQTLAVTAHTCEYKTGPAGVESHTPGLSWQIRSGNRNTLQTAYQVLVSDDSMLLKNNVANTWNSKKVFSDQCIQVLCKANKLSPTKTYYWKVKVWDNHNNESSWSAIAKWQMGLLTPSDWKGAKWIAYDKIADSNIAILPVDGKKDTYNDNNILPLLRKEFAVNKPVKKATMFICGLGHFEISLNGKKVGNHFLDPGWTKYDKQALYVVFDLTGKLQQGNNAIGVMLGNGFYFVPPVKGRYRKLKTAFGHPKMICRLVINYKDGSSTNIISDQSWKTAKSPITFSSIFGGEDYNANLEQEGWDQPAFNDSKWKRPIIVDGPPLLNAQMIAPVKVMQTFTPIKTSKLTDSAYVFDLGQNASGIPMIKVQGHKGDTVRIIPAELLSPDGSASQRSSGKPYYFDYVLKGDGVENWQPRFTYYGFRYLQVNGVRLQASDEMNALPVLLEIKGLHIRNSTGDVGDFSCSNHLFNRIDTLIDWAIKSNMVSLFTDCPHREKLGWLEEAHLMGNSLQYNYDIAQLGRKEVDDMRYSQTSEGLVPEIAPEYVKFEWGGDMFRDSPEWGSSCVIMPWYLYHWYGDRQVLAKAYPMMKRYIGYLQSKANGHILKQGLGDWYDLGPNPPGVSQLTPMGVTATAIYYYDLKIMNKITTLLDKPGDAASYNNLAREVKQAFNDTFYNKQTHQYATGSQAANAMAVYMNLVDEQDRDAVVANIVADVRNHNNSLTAGDIGYRYLLQALQQAGRSDVIFDMNNRSDVPGYGYQLAKDATALTESWQATTDNSNNHFMLGHLMEWFYSGLVGIQQADSSIAYKHIVIKPEPVGDVTSAKANYRSMYGNIVSAWEKNSDGFALHVIIPANTDAAVYLPASKDQQVTERNNISDEQDWKLAGYENGRAVIKLGSGEYYFGVK